MPSGCGCSGTCGNRLISPADDPLGAEKYEDLWSEYVRLVPRRIGPWLY